MSIRTRILLPIIFFSLVMIGYVYGYWMPSHLQDKELDLQDANQQHLASVAEGVVPLLQGQQLDALYETLEALKKRNPEWIDIQLHDNSGRILYPLQSSKVSYAPEKNRPIILQPVKILNDNLGLLTVKLDLREKITDLHSQHQQLLISTSLFLLLYILMLWFILDRGVIRPLDSLVQAAHRLAKGEFETTIVHKANDDEVGTLVDSFEHMRASIWGYQKELETKNDSLTTLLQAVQQSPIAIVITDIQRVIQFVNNSFCELTGHSVEEALGRECFILTDEHLSPDKHQEIINTISSGQTWKGEIHPSTKNNSKLLVTAFISPIFDNQDNHIHNLVILEDITRQRAMEIQLAQTQKMEAIGTLAGGIAHDFNNILSPIMGYTEMAQIRSNNDVLMLEYLHNIEISSKRAASLVRQILTFSRKGEDEHIPLAISSVIKEALKLLRASIPSSIEIKTDITTKSLVLADPTRIHQIAINLCTNAYQAMEKNGGILSVSLKDESIQGHQAVENDIIAGDYVVLEVSDTGAGIDKETQQHVFEPYFTTKEKGKGTGLGLAVVHGIVKELHGHILVQSTLGQGTTFKIFLPKMALIQEEYQPLSSNEFPLGNNEHILFVDDEESIRNMMTKFLNSYGYRVTACSNGQEAFKVFVNNPFDFALLITDMTMPIMNGKELTEKVLKINPKLPVFLCTGFSNQINREEAEQLGINKFLEKPLVMNKILVLIQEELCPQQNHQ